jgi:pimeloyl-ACP methyl ester carboxylesterase
VLLYDHPHFGRSDGEPRYRISTWRQARGYIDALTFLCSQETVDPGRVALWGDSLSAGEALIVTAIDPRVAALVCQVPSCGRSAPPADVDLHEYLTSVQELLSVNLSIAEYTAAKESPVVSADQVNAPSLLQPLTAFRWFIKYGGCFQTGWENRARRAEPVIAPPPYPTIAAAAVGVPTLFVVATNDEMPRSRPDVALMAYDRVLGPKEWVETEGGHFGLLYHRSTAFVDASRCEASFLIRYLVPSIREPQ